MKVGSRDFPLAHLAITVASLDGAEKLYSALGFKLGAPEIIEREHVRLQMASKGELRLELLEAYPAGSGPIAKFIARRGSGVHHIALRADNLEVALDALRKQGIGVLKGYPAPGAEGCRVAFLDPATTGGVLIELVAQNSP